MFKKLFLCYLAIFTSLPVVAGLYPVVTNVRTVLVGSNWAQYHITQSLVDIGPDADKPSRSRYVGLTHRHIEFEGATPNFVLAEIPGYVEKNNGETIGSAAIRAYQTQRSLTMIQHAGAAPNDECIGYVGSSSEVTTPWSSAEFPAGTCINVPPGNDWCSLETPYVELDHGIVRLSAGVSETVDSTMAVSCTAPMTVKVSFGMDVLNLAQGLTSTLSTPAGNTLSLPAGQSPVVIRSTLDSVGNIPGGAYQASTVAYIDYY